MEEDSQQQQQSDGEMNNLYGFLTKTELVCLWLFTQVWCMLLFLNNYAFTGVVLTIRGNDYLKLTAGKLQLIWHHYFTPDEGDPRTEEQSWTVLWGKKKVYELVDWGFYY